jgi:hypothetical protein
MAHPNEDLVRQGFAAFGRDYTDTPPTLFFAEDIRYHLPAVTPFCILPASQGL